MQERRQRNQTIREIFDRLASLVAVASTLAISPAISESLQVPDATPEAHDTAALSTPSSLGEIAYTPGRGLRLGDTCLTLGGYANVNLVRDEGSAAVLSADDLSFFVIWEPAPRLHLFSELELEDLAEIDTDGHGGTVNHTFTVERLYADFTLSDSLQIRAGKFLTPVGRWNVIHAQPLVWTTSRPLATLLPFDPHVTGAMLLGSLFPSASTITYSVFGQFVNEFERVAEPQTADRSAGGRLEYSTNELWSVGGSYLSYAQAGRWEHLVGVDGWDQHGPLQFMGEAVFEDGGLGTQWGFYLQSVTAVRPGLYLVGRYEHYAPPASPAVNLMIPGLAYKPISYIVFKAEYLIADHPTQQFPPGFKSSFAILF